MFAVLFVGQFVGFVALSVISLKNLSASDSGGGLGQSGGTSITLNASVLRFASRGDPRLWIADLNFLFVGPDRLPTC